jgi:hypothetical protein
VASDDRHILESAAWVSIATVSLDCY